MLWQAKKANGEFSSGSKPSKVVEFRRKPEQEPDDFSATNHPSTDAPVGLRERQWRRMVIALSGLSIAALALSGFTLYQLHQPQRVEQLAVHQKPTQLLHKSTVYSVAFSPDGKHIVSGSGDKTVQIWDVATGQPIGKPLIGHENFVLSVAFSPDGKRIVSGSGDKTVRIWDATTGQPSGDPLTGHTNFVLSVAFSPDGKRIVSGSLDKTVRIWDVATGLPIGKPLSGHEKAVRSAAFSPDGKRIVSGSGDKTVRLWDATTGQSIGKPLTGHSDVVYSVAFSPDGKSIVSGSEDKTVRVWDAATGQPMGKPFTGHSDMVYSVAFSPDGKRIVSGSGDKTVRLWDVPTIDSNQPTPDQSHKSSPSSPVFPIPSKGSETPRSMASYAIAPHLKTADDEPSFSSRQKPRQRPRHQLRPNRILAKSLPAKRLRPENNAKSLVYRPSGKLFVPKQAAP